jgi:putative radical SAM enzyme (TIGR03279 family)
MHISPINISVHTTNPELRVEMMGNPSAGEKLRYIRMLTDGGIKVNSQLVLCPGINDGKELERSISELSALCPNLQSIAVVPVGLTKHREGLYPLRTFNAEEAKQVVEITERWGDKLAENNESRIVYASDEFYLLAGLPIPEPEFYGDFDQLDNGVGLLALLQQEFRSAMMQAGEFNEEKHLTIATGELAYPMMKQFAAEIMERFPTVKIGVEKIVNDFFGHTVTVAGLVTGQDLIAQLKGKELGSELLIPSTMLRHEQDRFLDDVTREQVEQELSVSLTTTENDGFDLLEKILSPAIWE